MLRVLVRGLRRRGGWDTDAAALNERESLPDRGVLSKSRIGPGDLMRRLRIEATYSL